MWQTIVKVLVTTGLVVAVSEVARRSTLWAAVLASLPVTSLLALMWLHVETQDSGKIASLAQSIFWLTLPSLVFFVLLAVLLRAGWDFWLSLTASAAATACAYFAMLKLLSRFGISA